jgi:hypothetical protein
MRDPPGFIPARGALLLLAIDERLVVHPAAFLKLLLKDAPLTVREIDAVFEGFAHTFSIAHACLNRNTCSGLKRLKRGKGLYPRAKAPRVYTLFF